MGREWYWGGRSSKRGGAGGEKDASSSGCMNAVFQFFDFHQFRFALHHRKPSFEPTCFLPEEPTNPKGVEAPRNSLQSEELSLSCITREGEEEEDHFNIPIGIQIKTSGLRGTKAGAPNDCSSEISSSPGIKTPNLVARLMGLDLLPETRSPFSYSSAHGTQNPLPKSHSHRLRPPQPLQSRLRNILDYDIITGTRSLPETPRISSARRSNVDHRLSLQINKENLSASEDLEFSRFSYLRRKERRVEEENNRSPSEYARQIVKQMKEKVNRKVGMDITNTITNRDQGRSTELVNQFKSRKYSKAFTKVVEDQYSSPGKHSAPSCSPRLRFSESKIKSSMTQVSSKDKSFHYPKPSSSSLSASQNVQPQPIKVSVMKPKPQPLQKQQQGPKTIQKSEKIEGERFRQRLKKPPQTSDIIRNKQEEPFVRRSIATRANISEKKCKKTPLSNDLLNITVPNLLTVKKEPSPPATKIPQKQFQVFDAQESRCSSQLSSCTSHKYKPETTDKLMARESNDDIFNGDSTTGACGAEYEYVSNILRRTGIDKETCIVSFSSWFSPSHPLDPAILHELEYTGTDTSTAIFTTGTESTGIMPGRLGLGCNEKLLLFHLVDELLVEILKPNYIDMKPWASSKSGPGFCHMQGSQLIEKLCAKIRSFPCADCRVLEDIDALIDKDIPRLKLQSAMACEEEGEEMVTEIEKDILDTLVHETALEFW